MCRALPAHVDCGTYCLNSDLTQAWMRLAPVLLDLVQIMQV